MSPDIKKKTKIQILSVFMNYT